MTLIDEDDNEFEVIYLVRKIGLSGGWKGFAVAHDLVNGEAVVFQLIKPTVMKNSPYDPCLVHCCLHWCALCQEHKEMKNLLFENYVMPMTVVNPPPVQQMNKPAEDNNNNQNSAAPSSTVNNGNTNMEMQPL